jgi:hypothetical protein
MPQFIPGSVGAEEFDGPIMSINLPVHGSILAEKCGFIKRAAVLCVSIFQ